MANTGFEKATRKMLGGDGPGVRIAQPEGGVRVSRVERERMREEVERREREAEEGKRAQERRQVLQDLVDMNVLPQDGGAGASPSGAGAAPRQDAAAEAGPGENGKGRGRPLKNPDVKEYVLVNFRVPSDFRQRIKIVAAQQGRSVADIFEEALGLFFEKYGLGEM